MAKRTRIPCALTIAGSDSGGGAGIQADLKTFAALGVHGLTAITCLTAQNPAAVTGVQAASPRLLEQQLAAVLAGFRPTAMKTGMLFNRRLIEITASFAAANRRIPLVVDPVMIATSGACLLNGSATGALTGRLLPLATLLTPNVPEAEALTGLAIRTIEDQRQAARKLSGLFECAVVVKGGHLRGAEAADIVFDGTDELLLTAPHIRGVKTHGTGCTFSAAVTALLAKGCRLTEGVVRAKEFITQAIDRSQTVGRQTVLNPFWK
ncbi:MAG TPA: bifunctional hydroxymethylpyrimidine kinase/phosphomethylpyrimidine kinase [Verrucomicrobiales bacterium]|nr:bifunctional hydroxymethylpyrimidine kinase/phosphomethylpyrimidine kinase [Verrucomicrobiales bacterium]